MCDWYIMYLLLSGGVKTACVNFELHYWQGAYLGRFNAINYGQSEAFSYTFFVELFRIMNKPFSTSKCQMMYIIQLKGEGARDNPNTDNNIVPTTVLHVHNL